MIQQKIRIGTRGSSLALAQTELAISALKQGHPDLECEVVIITTKGDKILDKPLIEFGGKGVFINEFEDALINKQIDFAVHSAKDMPMELKDGLDIVGVLKREDPRDVLIRMKSSKQEEKDILTIGTSSLRRQVQVERLYENAKCTALRGNVNTRLKKLSEGNYDGIILAAAGLKRLNLDQDLQYQYRYFSIDEMVPAAGQGIIAIEGRKNCELEGLWKDVTDTISHMELVMERTALHLFSAGCHEPIGIYSKIEENQVTLWMLKELNGRIVKKKDRIELNNRLELVKSMVNYILEEI
jgi:hydroxymethylbilane synthase